MNEKRLGIDTLIAGAKSGELSRRDILKGSVALGLGLPFGMALVNAGSVGAQDAMTLSFDAGATQGGGGKPNAAAVDYSYIINGGSQFEINRMVDARLVTISADLQGYVGRPGGVVGDCRHDRDIHAGPERGVARWHAGNCQGRRLHDQLADRSGHDLALGFVVPQRRWLCRCAGHPGRGSDLPCGRDRSGRLHGADRSDAAGFGHAGRIPVHQHHARAHSRHRPIAQPLPSCRSGRRTSALARVRSSSPIWSKASASSWWRTSSITSAHRRSRI